MAASPFPWFAVQGNGSQKIHPERPLASIVTSGAFPGSQSEGPRRHCFRNKSSWGGNEKHEKQATCCKKKIQDSILQTKHEAQDKHGVCVPNQRGAHGLGAGGGQEEAGGLGGWPQRLEEGMGSEAGLPGKIEHAALN